MTFWGILSLLLHWLGLIRWGEALWEKHELVKKAKEIKDVATGIDRMSDDDVSKQLRKWTRD